MDEYIKLMYVHKTGCYNVNMTVSSELLERKTVDSFWSNKWKRQLLQKSIELAFEEDLAGDSQGDVTTTAIVGRGQKAKAVIYCKQADVVLAGLEIIEQVFACRGSSLAVKKLVSDGTEIKEVPAAVAIIEGVAQEILTTERTLINLLQRMSGIATTTKKFVDLASPHGILILDTRKTTPGLRVFERYAVTVGGGTNHRFGLHDAILIKDNHIQVAGSVSQAVSLVRTNLLAEEIEVECTDLEQVKECLLLNVEKIMLDNMTPSMVSDALHLVNGRCFIEISGGINLTNINSYLQPGVNAISIGALTHSVASVDLSLEVQEII